MRILLKRISNMITYLNLIMLVASCIKTALMQKLLIWTDSEKKTGLLIWFHSPRNHISL